MAITATTLSAAIGASDLTITVASGTGFPTVGANPLSIGYLVRIDGEYMWATQQPTAGVIKLRGRGSQGTPAVAHDLLAKVEVSSDPQDFNSVAPGAVNIQPPWSPAQQTLGQNTTFTAAQIAALTQDTEFAITKATAATITLPAPSKAQDGLKLTFTSLTDAAHVVTGASLLANAGAASPYTTATMANAKAGGALVLEARNGLWNVLTATNWTLT